MILEKDNALRCARMTKIRLRPEETALYDAQLKDLFAWVEELSKVDTSSVPETSVAQAAYLRADEPVTDEPLANQIIHAFNASEGRSAKVKKVL